MKLLTYKHDPCFFVAFFGGDSLMLSVLPKYLFAFLVSVAITCFLNDHTLTTNLFLWEIQPA